MRWVVTLGFLSFLGTLNVLAFLGPPPLSELDQREAIRLGCEWMSSYQSSYIFRGEDFGSNAIELQLAGGVAIDNDWNINGQVYGVTHLWDANYAQWTVSASAHYYLTDECVIGPTLAGQFYSNTPLKSGVEPGCVLIWNPNSDWSFNTTLCYDSGQKGAYFQSMLTWEPLITERMAWSTTASVGLGFHYLDKTGLREGMVKTGPLIGINSYWRVRPYIGYYHGEGKTSFNKIVFGVVLSCSF